MKTPSVSCLTVIQAVYYRVYPVSCVCQSQEDKLEQILVDIQEGSQNDEEVESEQEEDNEGEREENSRGIDLMASDDEEDEEEIEPENE